MHKTHRMTNLFVVILLVGCLNVSCSTSPKQLPELEYWPTHEWRSASPETQGMSSMMLAQMYDYIQKEDIRLHSLLVVRNGYLVTEAYWDPYGPANTHTIESNTKSIIGALVGIAIDQGALKSVDQKLVDFFPERKIQNLDAKKRGISLKNLLSMTPGLDCQDQTPQADGMYQATNWIGYLLDLSMTTKPGSQWVYCSGAVHLLSAVVGKATGMDARTYANRSLFEPLGIPAVAEKDWGADLQGVTNGITGLYLTPRDLAKFGLLYLENGKWEGYQVVPSRWVEESTREQAYIGKDDYIGGLERQFGYLWSLFPEQGYYGYLGRAGQELFVLPDQNMVIVFTGALEVGKEAALLKLVNDFIVPAAHSKGEITPVPGAVSRLESFIQAAATPTRPVPVLPQTALDTNGKTYMLEANTMGWQEMSFVFQPGSPEASLIINGSQELRIGLDNRYRLSEAPDSRPVGLKAYWEPSGEFVMEFIILGDFIQSRGRVKFEQEKLTLTFNNLNFGGQALVLHGSTAK